MQQISNLGNNSVSVQGPKEIESPTRLKGKSNLNESKLDKNGKEKKKKKKKDRDGKKGN
jgi:hypothetical protein